MTAFSCPSKRKHVKHNNRMQAAHRFDLFFTANLRYLTVSPGQNKRKGSPRYFVAGHLDPATVLLADALHKAEAKPPAGHGFVARRTIEAIEYAVQLIRRDRLSGIVDVELQFLAAHSHAQTYFRTLSAVFDRVADQVQQSAGNQGF